jgi:LemA protein
MGKGLVGVLVALLLLVGLAAVILVPAYNNFVTLDQEATKAWSQVENVYQRRFDLIPNLVESVKGYMKQEQTIFTAIAEARTRYAGAAPGSTARVEATGQVESALARLLVIMENYPTLKSDTTVARLMDELAGTENRISVERGRYNEAVQTFNTAIRKFPGVLIAGLFGFGDQKPYFKAAEGAATAPKVDFSK